MPVMLRTIDLPDFLAERIYDDECAANGFALPELGERMPGGFQWEVKNGVVEAKWQPLSTNTVLEVGVEGNYWQGVPAWLARWDPARVLLEVEAKRGILLDYMTHHRQVTDLNRAYADNPAITYPLPSDLPLRYLALPYSDHPDWQESWRPPTPGTIERWGRR